MSTLYAHPTSSKSSEYDDESMANEVNYGWKDDGKYRGKNYSPRHRKYYRNNRRNKYDKRNNYRDDKNSYRTRSPNRSPRHLKARALRVVEQARKQKEISHQISSPNNTAKQNHENYKYYGSPTSQAVKLPLPDDNDTSHDHEDMYYVTNNNAHQHDVEQQPPQQLDEEKDIECDPEIMNLPDFQLDEDELECFQDVSISTIQSLLDEQRLQNGTILAKLHFDQEQFLSVCQDYEIQNELLKREILKYEQENEGIAQKVQLLQNILIDHKNENLIHNEEVRQTEIIKASLWDAVSTNITLLQQVNELNGQIDSYHMLIAKKSQQLTILEKEKAKKEKEAQEITANKDNKNNNDNNLDGDDEKDPKSEIESITTSKVELLKDTPFDLMSVGTLNTNLFDFPSCSELDSRMDEGDILKSYADQLVSKNERYQEILKLLRNKVDELRDTRTRL